MMKQLKTLGYESAQTTWIYSGLCGFRSHSQRPAHSIGGTAQEVSSPKVLELAKEIFNKTFCSLAERLKQDFLWNEKSQLKRANEAQTGVDLREMSVSRREQKGFIF